MFKKAKSFIQTKVQAVKDFCAEKVSQKAHEVLDGTIAEAYVDTGVKILIAVVSVLFFSAVFTLSSIQPLCLQSHRKSQSFSTTQVKAQQIKQFITKEHPKQNGCSKFLKKKEVIFYV